MKKPLSVTIFAAAPGTSGKAQLERLTNDCGGLRIAAITPWNPAKRVAARSGLNLLPTTPRLKKLGQGCSCCTVRWDILKKVRRLAEQNLADHVVIQVPPQSDLDSLSKTFTVADDNGDILVDIAQIEQVVTMVDGPTLLETLGSDSAAVLMERVGIAHMVWVDGATELDETQTTSVVRAIEAINPGATLHLGDRDGLPVSKLMKLGSGAEADDRSDKDSAAAINSDVAASDSFVQSY